LTVKPTPNTECPWCATCFGCPSVFCCQRPCTQVLGARCQVLAFAST